MRTRTLSRRLPRRVDATVWRRACVQLHFQPAAKLGGGVQRGGVVQLRVCTPAQMSQHQLRRTVSDTNS